jgi:hypothetical protein
MSHRQGSLNGEEPLSELDMLISPVVSRLTERPRSNSGVSQTQDVNARKRWDGLLKRLPMPITAVMSQENAVWNKDVVEEQVG